MQMYLYTFKDGKQEVDKKLSVLRRMALEKIHGKLIQKVKYAYKV